jgi:tetratricopeptide (TPR) repeat protein
MAYSREMEKLERQFAENPRRFAAPFADALRKNDDVERALEVIRVGLELNPDYIPGSVILGRCHLDLGDDNGAEAAFSRVLDLDNENVIALRSLADIMERQGRNDEAISFLTYLLDVDRSNDEAREQLARIGALPVSASSSPPADAADTETPPVEVVLEPTALWEPPEVMAEASISSWVEPTSADAIEPPAHGESLLEEPPTTDDVAPLDGFESAELAESSGAAEYEEFVLEREEEIVLTSMSGAEYQVANDSESLLEHTLTTPVEDAGNEDVPEDEVPGATSESGPVPAVEPEPASTLEPADSEIEEPVEAEAVIEAVAEVVVEEHVVEEAPAAELTAELVIDAEDTAETVVASEEVDDVDPTDAVEDEAPFEWAMHVGEAQEFHPTEPTHTGAHAPDSFDSAIEGIAPVDEDLVEPEDEDTAAAAEAEPPVLMVTESMAELYAVQGHPSEALGVYRILYDRNPDNERLRLRIQELEGVLAAQVLEDAEPSYAASVTGGKAVASFLGAMLGARPEAVDLPEPPPAPELPANGGGDTEGDEEAVASGAPTRPAIDRVSLGAIFGEDPSPVPPAENTATDGKGESAGGFSFDDFFGGGEGVPTGRTSSGSVRATRASDDEDDLDQFHSWLQSLKR